MEYTTAEGGRRTARATTLDGKVLEYDLGREKERIFEFLEAEGGQSTCQVAVSLNLPYSLTNLLLRELVHIERKVNELNLPPFLQRYQEYDADGKPLIFLYEVKNQERVRRRTVLEYAPLIK